MMPLEAFELRDHHLAGWDQRAPVLVRESARHEDLGKARIGSSFLGWIVRCSDDQVVNHLTGVLDAIGWDAAAMSVAQVGPTASRVMDGTSKTRWTTGASLA